MICGISYFGVRNPKWVLKDMEEIYSKGFTHVLHTYSEEDLQYYEETMKEIIDSTTNLGLSVYVNPWGVGRVFGGEAYSELISKDHSLAQKDSSGNILPAVCPNKKEFHEYLYSWIEAVSKTKATHIFWDEPHFYFTKKNLNLFACQCDTCKKLFFEKYGYPLPNVLTEDVKDFRENCLIDFLDKMTSFAKSKGKKNTVCLLPPWFPAGIDNWDSIAKLKNVDEIACDPYQEKGDTTETVKKYYRETSEKLMQLFRKYNKPVQMWIKNYSIESGKETDIKVAIEETYKTGIKNIFAWSYLGTKYLSWLKSDNPEKVFEVLVESLNECKAKEAF